MRTSRIIKFSLFFMLLVGTGICYHLLEENREQKRLLDEYRNAVHKPITEQVEKIVYISKKDSTTHIQQEIVKSEEISNTITKSYNTYVNDTLSVALNIATDKIKELTRIKAKLEGELEATKVELAENKSQRVYYENKYLSIITHEDSLGNPLNLKYSYNAEINIAQFSKRKNFWSRKRDYIDISSPDKNFKINGMEHFKKEISLPSRRLGLGFQMGYGVDRDFRPNPYIGVGLSYNLIKF